MDFFRKRLFKIFFKFNYLKHCYFIWGISVVLGIVLFNNSKDFILKHNEPILIVLLCLILFFVLLYFFSFKVNGQICLPKKTNLFLIITSILFFIAPIVSSNLFYIKNNDFFSFLANNKKEIFKNKNLSLEASGRISSHPTNKNNNRSNKIYFSVCLDNIKVIKTNNTKISGAKDIKNQNAVTLKTSSDIFVEYENFNKKNFNFKRDDFVNIKINDIKVINESLSNENFILKTAEIERNKPRMSFFNCLYFLRKEVFEFLSKLYEKNLNKNNSAFAFAVILGNQDELSENLKKSFRASGLYHMLSISGLHVTILFTLISFSFEKLKLRFFNNYKFFVNILIILLLIFYNFLTGAKPGMLRASIFFILILLSKSLNEYALIKNILFIALIILLILHPLYLQDISFILSFLSTAGIIIIYPVFLKALSLVSFIKNISENYFFKMIFLNFSIYILVLPSLVYFFQGFSLISFLSNIFASPIFHLTLLFLFLTSVFSIIIPLSGRFLISINSFFINIFVKTSDFFARLPFSYIETDFFNNRLILYFYYFFIILIFIVVYNLPNSKFKKTRGP